MLLRRGFARFAPAGGSRGKRVVCSSGDSPALLQRMTLCIRASREIGANQGIAQFSNWAMNTAPRCSTLIRVIRAPAKNIRHPRGGGYFLVLQRGLEPRRACRFATGFAALSAPLKNASRLVSVGSSPFRHKKRRPPLRGDLLFWCSSGDSNPGHPA